MFSQALWDPLEDIFPFANPHYHSQNPCTPRVSHVMVAVPERREQTQPAHHSKQIPEFKRTLELGHFKPEDLKVNLTGDILTVEGTVSGNTENSSFESSFKRMFRVPKGIDPETVYCRMGEGGKMEIGGTKKIHNPNQTFEIKVEQSTAGKQIEDKEEDSEKEKMEQ